jgi:single-strand DNA-binding protein
MSGVNKVILLGRLGKDPEIRVLEGGRKVANFTLATSESYKDKNGNKQEATEWHNCVFWGPIVEVIEKYVKKGQQLCVDGKLRTRSYEDKEGVKKYVTEILGNSLHMFGKGNNEPAQEAEVVSTEQDEDDLPF